MILSITPSTLLTLISTPRASPSFRLSQRIADSGCAPVRINVPPPVLLHSPATGELEPFRLSSPFINSILLFFACTISAAFLMAGAYTKFSAYINFLPDFLITFLRLRISSSIFRYITRFDTVSPIGSSSPGSPK